MQVKSGLQRAGAAVCLLGSLSISFIAVLWVIVSRDRIDIAEGLLVLASALVALARPGFGARALHNFDVFLGRIARRPPRAVLLVGSVARCPRGAAPDLPGAHAKNARRIFVFTRRQDLCLGKNN